MIFNPTCSPLFLFLLLFFRINFFGMAQNSTIPVNVGVVVDFDSLFGKIGLSCINMALSDFYASHAYYNTRLLLHTRDSMTDVVFQAAAALDLIKNVEVQAIIIGPESSMQTNFVIDLGDKAHVPIISFSTTRPSTSFPSSYFFRVAQNDASQVQAVSAIIQAFGWREVVPIYVNNEFGEGVIPYLTNALQEVGAHIPYLCVIPPMATDDQIVAKLHQLMTMQTRVFIVHMLPSLGSRLFAMAKEIGMMGEGYVWIMTDGMTNFFGSINSSVLENMQGALGLRTYAPNTPELENFTVRWQRKFQNENPANILKVELDVFGLWAYDAAWALAMAVENVRTTNFNFQKMNISGDILEGLGVSQTGPELVQTLSSTIFRGLSGHFSLVNGQLESSNFEIVNVHGNGVKGIGYWTPQNGLVRHLNSPNTGTYSNASTFALGAFGTIIWPGDTTTIPKGWQISGIMNKLKVLVPVTVGFEQFMNVTYDPTTNTTKVTGFCIDVFETVIKELPYDVPFEYYPFGKPDGQSSGTYNDLVFQVFLGNYDAAVGDITIRANRSLYVDFSLTYTQNGISMVAPIKSLENTWVFLKPLTWELWLISGCSFIFIGFVVWVLEHRINEDFRGPSRWHQIGTCFWFSFSTMVFAHSERVLSNLARFVVIVWCFVVLVLTQSYTASLASHLTVQQLQPTVADVNLLLKNGDKVGYQEGSFVYMTLRQVGFQDDKIMAYTSTDDLDELFKEGIISAAFDETPYLELFLSTYCSKYTMVEPTFNADGFAFVFPKGSPLTLDVSKVITNLGRGVIRNIQNKWFQKKASNCIGYSNTTGSSNSSNSPLSLDSFWGLFLIVWVSSSLALLIFAAMFLYDHREIWMNFDPQASFWTRISVILKAYDKKDTSSHTLEESKVQESVRGIGTVESSPNNNINYSPRPSTPLNDTVQSHSTVFEMQERPSIHVDSDPNGQATRPIDNIVRKPWSRRRAKSLCQFGDVQAQENLR